MMENPIHKIFKGHAKAEIHESDCILRVENLVKTYDDFTAVNNISFSVKRGSLFAFLGLNGAGKSTTINIITSILNKDSGKIYVDDLDQDFKAEKIKEKIGIVFQESVLDPNMSPRENLSIRAAFYGIRGEKWKEREKILIEMLHLESFYDRQVSKLSGGQKRRVDIARAMVHNPKLLILDEPTTGLDPQTRKSVWDLVNDVREKTDMTVFLTTHYMEEAEKATYVVIMDKGEIIASGTPLELKTAYSGTYAIIYSKENDELKNKLVSENYTYAYNEDLKCYKITIGKEKDVLSFLNEYKNFLTEFEIEKGSMDDVFLNVTGKDYIAEVEHE